MEEDPNYAYANKILRSVSKDSPECSEPLPDAESLTFIFAISAVVCNEVYVDVVVEKKIVTHDDFKTVTNLK